MLWDLLHSFLHLVRSSYVCSLTACSCEVIVGSNLTSSMNARFLMHFIMGSMVSALSLLVMHLLTFWNENVDIEDMYTYL